MLDGNPADIPKEELLHLCMKLNKRMQTMETKGKELLKKKISLQADREKLVRLLENALGSSLLPSAEADLDHELVEERFNTVILKALRFANGSQSEVPGEGPEPSQVVPLPAPSDALYREQIKSLEAQLAAKQTQIDTLRATADHQEEQIVFFQMQLSAANTKVTALSKGLEEKEIAVASSKEMLQAIQSRLIEIEPEHAANKHKLATMQVMKMENDQLVSNLKKDLRLSLEDRDALVKKSKELEERCLKVEGSALRVAQLTEAATTAEEELEANRILIARLRQEAVQAEQAHAMRTALLATAEATIEGLTASAASHKLQMDELVEKIASLQVALSSLEHVYKDKVCAYEAQLVDMEAAHQALQKQHQEALARQAQAHEEALESMKKENTKKSAMARSILSEREEEVRTLSMRCAQLQEEITSGHPTERRIFEIAHNQSKRDAFNENYRDTREISFQQLQSLLASRDLDLAQSQAVASALQAELATLRLTAVPAGAQMNLAYLKNILLQYMSLPVQSAERCSLVTVLAALLHFTPAELSQAMQGTKHPVYTALPVKEVKQRTVTSRPPAITTANRTLSTPIMPSPRTRVLTAEEAAFQEKLNQISGDILSLNVSYDELDVQTHSTQV